MNYFLFRVGPLDIFFSPEDVTLFTSKPLCSEGSYLWHTISPESFSWQCDIHVPETFPMSTHKSQSNLGEVQGCSRERKGRWVWVTMLSSLLMWIRSGRGLLKDFLVFVHSLAMAQQMPISTHPQLTRQQRGNGYCHWRESKAGPSTTQININSTLTIYNLMVVFPMPFSSVRKITRAKI